ncbi:MAG: sugar ABC transporter substrate-binding protein, partial [Intestinibacillus sp.]
MKRKIAFALSMAMAFGLFTGCGNASTGNSGTDQNANSGAQTTDTNSSQQSGGSGSGKLKIGLSISARDQWVSNMEQAAIDKAAELGVEFNSFDANTDPVTQISHVQTCAADGYDAMVVHIVNTDNANEILNAAGDMKIVFVNRVVDESLFKEGQIVYVGSNEEEAGTYQGEYISKKLKDEGKTEANIAILTGTLGMQAMVLRTASAKKALEDSGLKINYVFEDTAEWDRAKAMDKFTQFLGSGKPVDAVICNNDEMALGAIEAMKTSGQKKVICPVAGIDATSVALESIVNG